MAELSRGAYLFHFILKPCLSPPLPLSVKKMKVAEAGLNDFVLSADKTVANGISISLYNTIIGGSIFALSREAC